MKRAILMCGVPLVLALSVPATRVFGESATAQPEDAEYAIRWDPEDGGPARSEDVLALLQVSADEPERYTVRYYDLERPANAPAGSNVILREREKSGGKTQFRVKYRLSEPLAGEWSCPPGEKFDREAEVDVSFGGAGETRRVYSYSCSLKAKLPPASLRAVAKPCTSTMTRRDAAELRVEEWVLPGGRRQLEVSRSARNDAGELARFAGIVEKLLARGVKPSDRSKTELGSQCP